MPRDVPCTAEGCQAASVVIITNLETGESDSLCADHFPGFIYAAADTLGFIPAQEQEDPQIRAEIDDDTPPPEPKKRGRTRAKPADADAPAPLPEPGTAAPDIAQDPE